MRHIGKIRGFLLVIVCITLSACGGDAKEPEEAIRDNNSSVENTEEIDYNEESAEYNQESSESGEVEIKKEVAKTTKVL